MRLTIKLVGLGGQGVVASGIILARSFFDEGYYVLQSQTYGAASRGALSSASVIVQDSPIMDLSFDIPDVLVLLSREGVKKHQDVLYIPKLVVIDELFRDTLDNRSLSSDHENITWIPASRLAREHFEDPIMLNMIVLGALTYHLSDIISKESVTSNIAKQWPKWAERNIKGFEVGWRWITTTSRTKLLFSLSRPK